MSIMAEKEFSEISYGTGIYRSSDPIKNFKIRVRLEKAPGTGPSARVKDEAGPSSTNNEMLLSNLEAVESSPKPEIEEYTFHWQEKVFSRYEMAKYARETECHSVLHIKYNEMINELQKTGRPTQRLFSYTDADISELQKDATTARPTFLSENVTNLRRRKGGSNCFQQKWPQSCGADTTQMMRFRKTNIVNYNPIKSQQNLWHVLVTPVSSMQLMVEIGPNLSSENQPENLIEIVLCTICVDGNGVLCVEPDFSSGRKPYKLETGNLGREVYYYTIENASDVMPPEDEEQHKKINEDLYLKHKSYLMTTIGLEFEMPPADIYQLFVFGEIVSAENFEYDGLFVNFFVDLPPGWEATQDTDEPIYRVTQTCRRKCAANRKNLAYFSYPFTYKLKCPLNRLSNSENESLSRWPQLCLHVMSRDWWNRTRTEGYGHVPLLPVLGNCVQRVETWRPIAQSLNGQLRRYFIGGSPELDDPTSVTVTSTLQGKNLNRYGWQTETSGTITVRLYTVQQCQAFMASEYRKTDPLRATNYRISSLQSSVEAVLNAFQRARQRMLAAREDL